ncbi:MAG: hypothetical protein AAF206_32225, partial [Bacteroidota bacterium]
YHQIYQMLLEPEQEEHFDQLMELLDKNWGEFLAVESRAMYKYAQNYCIRQLKLGNSRFWQESFSLFSKLLDNGLLLDEGHIAPTDFQNVCNVAIRLGKHLWAKEFLTTYGQKIPSAHQTNVLSFCRANLLSAQGKASEAIRLLQEVQFTDVSYQITARQMLLKLYLDQQDWDSALYHIDAFSIFTRRNKMLTKMDKKGQLAYLRMARKIVLLAEKSDKLSLVKRETEAQKIRESLLSIHPLNQRQWLIQRLDSLIESD